SDSLGPQEEAVIPPVNVRVDVAALSDLSVSSLLTGRLEAVDEAQVFPKVPGEVTRVYVELGGRVSKGSPLFELDKTQMATALNQARLSLDDATTNLERMTALYSEGAIPLQTYEQAQSAVSMARESYTAASDAYGNASITAPISGYVTSVNVAAGGIASQAVPAVTISNIDRLEISANLSENMINKVRVGDSVDVLVKSVSDTPFSGAITALAPAPAAGSLTYPIIITLENPGDSLKPGMFSEVSIVTDRLEGVLAIPSKSVMIKSGRQTVATIGADGQVVFRDVVTGVDNGVTVEIREGLAEGERVVVEGQAYVDETSRVNIVE
ncbi:MAG: efflux RND transporter periplasmic adaptor subunit, partial [Clostridiales Family XIII bacterium]|nr:efflux RND transporter periplasmic adaptor subunit [Clostridiales Family XIII bacterium]